MKKIVYLVISLSIFVSFTGCGENSSDTNSSESCIADGTNDSYSGNNDKSHFNQYGYITSDAFFGNSSIVGRWDLYDDRGFNAEWYTFNQDGSGIVNVADFGISKEITYGVSSEKDLLFVDFTRPMIVYRLIRQLDNECYEVRSNRQTYKLCKVSDANESNSVE